MKPLSVLAAVLKLAVIATPAVVYVLAQQSKLHDAAASGDLQQVIAALKPWKSIDAMNREGHTALGVAAARRHEAVARFLIERGANPVPDEVDDDRQPLGMVATAKNPALTRAFLAAGVSPNARLKSGRPWLLSAVEQRDRASVETLLAAGASPGAGWNQNAEHAATPLSSALIAHADKDIDEGLVIAELLLAKGATVAAGDPALRKTIAHILSSRRYDTGAAVGVERLHLLVEKGYPLEAPVPRDSLLAQAAYAGNLEAVRYLIAKGANPMGGAKPCREAKCPIDGTPLHRVAERRSMPKLAAVDQAIAQALLAAGADPDSPDQYGRTPAALAERSKNSAVAAALSVTTPAPEPAREQPVTASEPAKAPPPQLYAGHPGDPKGVDPHALLAAAGSELHAVVAYAPPRDSTAIEVEVSAQGKPVTLFLTAYKTVDWQLRVLPGVALGKVVALGQEPQRVHGLPAGTQLVVRSAQQHGSAQMERVYYRSDRDEMRRVVDRITEMAGVAPKSLIAGYEFGKVLVDGTTTSVELPAPVAGPSSAVTFAARKHEGKLSDDKLTATYCCAGASSTLLASRGYRRGQRYFEAKLELPFTATKPTRWTNIGVTGEDQRDLEEDRNGFIGLRQHDRFKDGDVFGVAIDYDERMAYFRVNGKWVSGEPGSRQGMKLPARGELFAAVSVASGREAWTANFGAAPFKSPPPPGYLPYAAPP